jgi:hypothetical protein
MTEIERLTAERDFLLLRAGRAGSVSFGNERWTGMSSNALVEVAFGQCNHCLPSDANDLAACYRTVLRLPTHLRTGAVLAQLAEGEAHVRSKYPDDIKWAQDASGWSARDSGRLPKGEDTGTVAECEASQSGDSEAGASPTPFPASETP